MIGQPVVQFIKRRMVTISRMRIIKLLLHTFLKWQKDNCMDMGAALAYYALFSLAPTILVVLSVFGFLVGPDTDIHNQILRIAQEILTPVANRTVESVLIQLNQDRVRVGVAGFMLLLVAASGFFAALDRAFDIIWNHQPYQTASHSLNRVALVFVKRRVFSFALVFGAAVLFLLSLLSNVLIRITFRLLRQFSEQVNFIELDTVITLNLLQLVSSFILLTLVLMVLFKALPTVPLKWGDVWLGSVITAVLFLVLQNLVSRSVIGIGSQFQSYGVVGGVMVLLLWIYLTSQIFFLGGEFTYVYAQMFGSRRALANRESHLSR